MAEDQTYERSEQATPKRRREAQEKGQVPRSRELTTFGVMLVGSGGLLLLGDRIVSGLGQVLTLGLRLDRSQILDPDSLGIVLQQAGSTALQAMTPFFILIAMVALFAPLALGGWSFSPQNLAVKLEKLDPIKGFGKLFSPRGLMELVKALAKFALIATVAMLLLWNSADAILALNSEPLPRALAHTANLVGWVFVGLSLTLFLIAAVDIPFQLWSHSRQIKMTREEVKDELKETEGRPEVKGRIRNLQREMAQRRMMAEVPKADVIVTNPTHYAVALRYDPDSYAAPIVVAKGLDLVAVEISRIGRACEVPLLSTPSLARALYYSTELEQPIPDGLYLAVAQVLAYVYQLRTAHRQGTPEPEPVTDLPIPDELKR